MPPQTYLKNLADNTSELSEKINKAQVRKVDGNLDVLHVVLLDPSTGLPLGASSFFPTFSLLSFTQAAAVQNTWYTAYESTNTVFGGLGVGITVANETVEIRVTIDGVVILSQAVNLLFATNKFTDVLANPLVLTTGVAVINSGAAAAVLSAGNLEAESWLGGRNVKIEVRKTSAGGASAIQVFGVYRH